MPQIKRNRTCTLCELSKNCYSVNIMGAGKIPATVMFVGEAPGAEEDREGKPFIGQSGALLRKYIALHNIEDKFITNVVKCRPKDNITPKASEIKACNVYLQEEFRRVEPKHVVLLGATALKTVLGKDKKITELRGQAIQQNGITYYPMYHPAYILRYPEVEPIFAEDFKRFADGMNGKKREDKVKITVVDNPIMLNEMTADIRESSVVSIDIETNGLKPRKIGAKITCISITTETTTWAIPLNHKDSPLLDKPQTQFKIMKAAQEAIKYDLKEVVGHNGKFDFLWLKIHYGWDILPTFDTQIAAHLLNENRIVKLKVLLATDLNVPFYDLATNEKLGDVDLQKLLEYNGKDSHYTLTLYYLYQEAFMLEPKLEKLFREFLIPVSHLLMQAEDNGIYIAPKRLDKVKEQLTLERDTLLGELNSYAKINWNSLKQLKEYFTDNNYPLVKLTPKGSASFDEEALTMLTDEGVKEAETLLKYRKINTLLNNFAIKWAQMLEEYATGRLYPSYNPTGTVTGRLSSDKPNIQQTPRNKLIRSLVDAPSGYSFVEFDLSQIELRVAAMYSNDPVMTEIYSTGGDIHTTTASAVDGRDITLLPKQEFKEKRFRAKAVNFGFLYRMSADKFQRYAKQEYGVNFSYREAVRAKERFFDAYPNLEPWHEHQITIAQKLRYVESPIGRRRRLPGISSDDSLTKWEAETAAINSPVQSFASDLLLMAAVEINARYKPHEVRVVLLVHDAIGLEIVESKAEQYSLEIKKILESPKLLERFKVKLTIPLESEFSIGAWGSK